MTFFHFNCISVVSLMENHDEQHFRSFPGYLCYISGAFLFDSKFNITLWQRGPFCLTCLSKPNKYVALTVWWIVFKWFWNIHQHPDQSTQRNKTHRAPENMEVPWPSHPISCENTLHQPQVGIVFLRKIQGSRFASGLTGVLSACACFSLSFFSDRFFWWMAAWWTFVAFVGEKNNKMSC